MKRILVALTLILMFCGCSDSEPDSQQKESDQTHVSVLGNDNITVYFADGNGVSFSAHHGTEMQLDSSKGKFQRHILQVSADLMTLESSTYDALKKFGYTRKPLKDQTPLYTANYLKAGHPTILATYRKLSPRKGGIPNTQLVLTWRINK